MYVFFVGFFFGAWKRNVDIQRVSQKKTTIEKEIFWSESFIFPSTCTVPNDDQNKQYLKYKCFLICFVKLPEI